MIVIDALTGKYFSSYITVLSFDLIEVWKEVFQSVRMQIAALSTSASRIPR